jgi:hypothetical protein
MLRIGEFTSNVVVPGSRRLSGETLLLTFSDEPLAQYSVVHETTRRLPAEVVPRPLCETQGRSPQLALWELDVGDWLKVIRVSQPIAR